MFLFKIKSYNRNKRYRFLSFTKLQRAISPILASILLLGLVTAGVVIGFLQIYPYMQRTQAENTSSAVEGSLSRLNQNILEMINEAGLYLPGSSPSRMVSINLPLGVLSSPSENTNLTYQVVTCDGSNSTTSCSNTSDPNFFDTTTAVPTQTSLEFLQHYFSLNYDLLPVGTLQYLSGSNPNQERDPVAYTGIGSIQEEDSSTNLSLYRDNSAHYIDLSYRPKVFLTQTIENNAITYNTGLYLINISVLGSFSGATSLKLTLKSTTISETSLTSTSATKIQLHMDVDGERGIYASVTRFGTTTYKLSTIVYYFEISS
ncbi:MAG: hypothetical protein ACXAC7_16070 [Candidatus Hodarchaeales archaeon]|jgi:hypothetical protein